MSTFLDYAVAGLVAAFIIAVGMQAYYDATTCAKLGEPYPCTMYMNMGEGVMMPYVSTCRDCIERKK